MTEVPQPTAIEDPEPRGLRGWLILVIIQLCLPPIILINMYVAYFPALLDRTPQHDPIKALNAILYSPMWLISSFGLYCLLRIVQKKRTVPRLMTIFYAICIADLIVYWLAYAGGYPNPSRVAFYISLTLPYPLDRMLELALSLAWMAYFNCSVRVRNTFVR